MLSFLLQSEQMREGMEKGVATKNGIDKTECDGPVFLFTLCYYRSLLATI